MSHSNSMELFREAPVPKAVFQNALPAMAAMLLAYILYTEVSKKMVSGKGLLHPKKTGKIALPYLVKERRGEASCWKKYQQKQS